MNRQIPANAASRLALAALLCASGHMANAAETAALAASDMSRLDQDTSHAPADNGSLAMSGPAFSLAAAPLPAAARTLVPDAPQRLAPAAETAPILLAQAAPVAVAPVTPIAPTPVDRVPPKPAPGPARPLGSPPPLTVPPPVSASTPRAPTPVATPVAGPVDTDSTETVATATAPGDAESLRDAIIGSLKNNPDIQIALAQQDDARFAIGEARAGYMPRLDLNVAYGPEIARPSHANPATRERRLEGTVTLSQNVWDWGVTINDIKRARASYRAAQWATREQIEAISFDITNAYLGILQQQKLIGLTNEEIAATQKILRMVTVQKDLGLTTQADVDRAKARVENVQSTLLDRKSALQQARDAYKRLTDHTPGTAIDLPPSIDALPETTEAAVDMIDDHSPRMAQAVEDRRSLDRQYASQTGTFLPRFGVQVQGNHKYNVLGQTGLSDDARAMVTMSYSFLSGGADVALRNRIGARLRQADYELDRRRREVEQDMRADFQSLGAARQKIATINSEIESAQRVADLYKQQFREGKRSVFDMLDSQQVLFAARGSAVTNGIAMQLAEYRVLQKLGGLFDLVSAGEPLPPLVVPAPVANKPKR